MWKIMDRILSAVESGLNWVGSVWTVAAMVVELFLELAQAAVTTLRHRMPPNA
jgi:hypothetical protein